VNQIVPTKRPEIHPIERIAAHGNQVKGNDYDNIEKNQHNSLLLKLNEARASEAITFPDWFQEELANARTDTE